MLTLLFSLFVSVAPVSVAGVVPVAVCETYAPNLEGVSVTVCGGSVVSRSDASGAVLFAASTYRRAVP